jgi:hypothetical protein
VYVACAMSSDHDAGPDILPADTAPLARRRPRRIVVVSLALTAALGLCGVLVWAASNSPDAASGSTEPLFATPPPQFVGEGWTGGLETSVHPGDPEYPDVTVFLGPLGYNGPQVDVFERADGAPDIDPNVTVAGIPAMLDSDSEISDEVTFLTTDTFNFAATNYPDADLIAFAEAFLTGGELPLTAQADDVTRSSKGFSRFAWSTPYGDIDLTLYGDGPSDPRPVDTGEGAVITNLDDAISGPWTGQVGSDDTMTWFFGNDGFWNIEVLFHPADSVADTEAQLLELLAGIADGV